MRKSVFSIVSAVVFLIDSENVWAQAFNSGSTGALGAFSPATNTVVTLPADGILNYTTVTIPAGVTVTFQRNATNTPVTMLATGNVTIAGIINVNGQNSITASGAGAGPIPGGLGGPGGFDGGQSGSLSAGTGQNGSAGRGSGGGQAGLFTPTSTTGDGLYGPDTMIGLIPLFGGSGGGGGGRIIGGTIDGGSGAGGGGAIVIASTTQIVVSSGGQILANGGQGLRFACSYQSGGGGSGGAIRLVAPSISNQGQIQALGSTVGCPGPAGAGRIRVEAFSFPIFNTTSPSPSLVTSPGPVTAASTPALTSLPTLKITTVGGISVPASPTGAYATPDVFLPAGTTNPITVTLTATNTPPGTIFRIQVMPQFAPVVAPVNTAPSTGTCTSSTASATVTVPVAQVASIKAYSAAFDFSCP
jgi:hypothetical protein